MFGLNKNKEENPNELGNQLGNENQEENKDLQGGFQKEDSSNEGLLGEPLKEEDGNSSDEQGTETPVLYGSTKHEPYYEIGDKNISLGEIVNKAFEKSGLSIEDWNAQEEEIINNLVDTELEILQQEDELNISEVLEMSEDEKAAAEVKGVRLKIDENIQYVESVLGKKSRVYNRLFSSKAWLGKLLEQLGTENPYKTEKPLNNPKNIPPTADVSEGLGKVIYDFKLKNEVEQIVSLREMLQESVDAIESLGTAYEFIKDKRLASIAKTQSYVNMCEARFELGYELSLIRDKNK